MARILRLVPYDPAWLARFEAEAARLQAVLSGAVLAVEHVAIAVPSEAVTDACIAPLEGLGYEYRGPYGEDPPRRYYVRDAGCARVAQIHLYVLPAAA